MFKKIYFTYVKIALTVIIIFLMVYFNNEINYLTRDINFNPILIFLLGVIKSIGTRSTAVKTGEWIVLILLLYLTIAFYIPVIMPSICIKLIIKSDLYSILYFLTGERLGYVLFKG